MAEPDPAPPDGNPGVHTGVAWEARCLLRAARSATLATSAQGQPFASLVTPAIAPDLSVLMLLSGLSEHTRHLHADPRCALLVVGAPASANPQTAPRLTVTGIAEPDADPASMARFLAVHPYAGLYAGFTDFAIWRVRPMAGLFVGGFARATRLRGAALAPDPGAVAAVAQAEGGIMGHCNSDHGAALAVIAGRPGDWRMVGADTDGCDLAQGEDVMRIAWRQPAANAGAIRGELVALAASARAAG